MDAIWLQLVKMGVWRPGGLEAWRPGGLEAWMPGGLVVWRHGGLVPWGTQPRGLEFTWPRAQAKRPLRGCGFKFIWY